MKEYCFKSEKYTVEITEDGQTRRAPVYIALVCDGDGNNKKLLSELEGVPTEKRTAHFACAICVSFPDGSEVTATGKCEGYIGYEKKGTNGFGYDPLFMVGDRSLAQMTAEEKDAISHRGNALKALKEKLGR